MRAPQNQTENMRPERDARWILAWFAPQVLALAILQWWTPCAMLSMAMLAGVVRAVGARHETDAQIDSAKRFFK